MIRSQGVEIRDNFLRLQEHISSICKRLGRKPDELTLVGITKYAETSQIKEAVEAGLKHIGENKVQEAQKKFSILESLPSSVTRHMVGHLQTNKVKQALPLFDLIQSVDSLKLAQEIEKQAAKLNRSVDILVQVNTAGEEQKFGVEPAQTMELIQKISQLENVRVWGLMTIAPYTSDKNMIHKCFRDLKKLRDHVEQQFWGTSSVEMKYLSMGMTDDYEIALEEGANMIRIGRAIFQ